MKKKETIHSINSNVKFPDMNYYDMNKVGDMALYLAHSDLYPFRSVIENNKIALDIIEESYQSLAENARNNGDFITEEWAMSSSGLHSGKVNLLTQYSLLLTLVSLLEEAINTLCHIYYSTNDFNEKLEDNQADKGLERAAKYLKKVVGIKGFTSDNKWEYITTIREARNMIVHNGGRITKDFEKFDKFSIGYRDEDKQIYLEYSDIIKMYDAIINFIDNAFRIQPSSNTTKFEINPTQ